MTCVAAALCVVCARRPAKGVLLCASCRRSFDRARRTDDGTLDATIRWAAERARAQGESKTAEQRGFVQGYCVALAEIARRDVAPNTVAEALRSAHVTRRGARRAGVDPYDMDALVFAFRENERRAARTRVVTRKNTR